MPTRDVFDEAQRQVYHLIDADAFPRFMQSIHAQMQVREVLEQGWQLFGTKGTQRSEQH